MKITLVVTHLGFWIAGFILGNHIGFTTSQNDCKILIDEFSKRIEAKQNEIQKQNEKKEESKNPTV
jgi:hypothetical protein